jgi:hypothetical protein
MAQCLQSCPFHFWAAISSSEILVAALAAQRSAFFWRLCVRESESLT